MTDKLYYSERHGRQPETPKLSLDDLKRAAKVYLLDIQEERYFQARLGHSCVDSGFSPGLIGGDPQIEIMLILGKSHLWPISGTLDDWTEDDFFDMVEFLYAHVSKPTERHYHKWDNCGWHCTAFDAQEGRIEFREKLNRLLRFYDSGFELTKTGEVLAIPLTGLEQLVEEPVAHPDSDNVAGRVNAAFTSSGATAQRSTTGAMRLGTSLTFSSFCGRNSSAFWPHKTKGICSLSRTPSVFAITNQISEPTMTKMSGFTGFSTTTWQPSTPRSVLWRKIQLEL